MPSQKKTTKDTKRKKISVQAPKPELDPINELDDIDIINEIQNKDPQRSKIIKTLEENYQEYPDIVQRYMLQLIFKLTGLGKMSYLLNENIDISKLDLPQFLEKNIYSKIKIVGSSIETLDEKKPEYKTLFIHSRKFFEIVFSSQCEILQYDDSFFQNMGIWMIELMTSKLKVVRGQAIDLCSIFLNVCSEWLEYILIKRNRHTQQQSQLMEEERDNDDKFDNFQNMIIKIEGFLDVISKQLRLRQCDYHYENRIKAVEVFFQFVSRLPQLFLDADMLRDTFQLLSNVNLALRLETSKHIQNILEIILKKDLEDDDNSEYKQQLIQAFNESKDSILSNFQIDDSKVVSEFTKLLSLILQLHPDYLSNKEAQYVFLGSLQQKNENSKREEMHILIKTLFKNHDCLEDMSNDNFSFEDNNAQSEINKQIVILIQDLIMQHQLLNQDDRILNKLVQGLITQKFKLVFAFPIMLEILNSDFIVYNNKKIRKSKEFHTILLKICLYSIEGINNIKKNSQKMQYLCDQVFAVSIISKSINFFSQVKQSENDLDWSLYLKLFTYFPISQMNDEFHTCLNNILQSSEYYFTLTNKQQVIDNISILYNHLSHIQQPNLSYLVQKSATHLSQHIENQIQNIPNTTQLLTPEQNPQLLNEQIQNAKNYIEQSQSHQESFILIIQKALIFTMNQNTTSVIEIQSLKHIYSFTAFFWTFQNDSSLKFNALLYTNKLLFSQFKFHLHKNIKNFNDQQNQFSHEYLWISDCLMKDCVNYLERPQELYRSIGSDSIKVLDLFFFHLTEWIRFTNDQENVQTAIMKYVLLFSSKAQTQNKMEEEDNEQPQEVQIQDYIRSSIQKGDQEIMLKGLQMWVQVLKLINFQSQLATWESDLVYGLWDTKVEHFKKMMNKFWVILKKKEIEDQNYQWFWAVVQEVMKKLAKENDFERLTTFHQVAKKQYFNNEKLTKQQDKMWRDKFMIFLISSPEKFLLRQEYMVAFKMLDNFIDGKKSFFTKDVFYKLFIHLNAKIEDRGKQLISERQDWSITESENYKYIDSYKNKLLYYSGYKKVQNSDNKEDQDDQEKDQEITSAEKRIEKMNIESGAEDSEEIEDHQIELPNHLKLKKSNLRNKKQSKNQDSIVNKKRENPSDEPAKRTKKKIK